MDPAVKMLYQQFSMQVNHIVAVFPAISNTSSYCADLWSQNSSWSQFVSAALMECVHHEQLQALTPYLQLEQVSVAS